MWMRTEVCPMLKVALVCLFLLSVGALHGSCTPICKCPDACENVTDDLAPMACLLSADHSALTAPPNEAVCDSYSVLIDNVTQDPYCEFTNALDPIVDMCHPGGSFCIIQNPNKKLESCHKQDYYCNYLLQCPLGQLLWLQCLAMDLPDTDNNGDCIDEVTIVSPFVVNGQQSVCGSACSSPMISINSMEIKYGSSHCCHNYGFRFASFCSSPINPSPQKKRASPRESCPDRKIIEVPADGKLQYSNRTIYLTLPSLKQPLKYREIQVLFIEDKLRGNSVYIDAGVKELYGYGLLEIVGYVAYYRYFTVLPCFLPNAEEVEYITRTVVLLSDIVSSKTYNSVHLATDTPRDGGELPFSENKEVLHKALQYAYKQVESSNPFVSGISKETITILQPLFDDHT